MVYVSFFLLLKRLDFLHLGAPNRIESNYKHTHTYPPTVSLERWCRLRGNLLFYFKTSDQFSEPQGLIVLEKCEPTVRNEQREHDGYVFYIEFQDGLKQRLAAGTVAERADWMQAIRLAGYDQLRRQLQRLREQIERRRGNGSGDVDVDMVRLQVGKEIGDLIEF